MGFGAFWASSSPQNIKILSNLMNIVTVVFIKVPIGKERVGIGMSNIKF